MKSFLMSLFLLLGMTFYSPLKAQPPQDSVYLYIETDVVNESIEASVRVYNFKKVQGFQFSIEYEKNNFEAYDLEFNNLVGLNLGNVNIQAGKLSVLWLDPSNDNVSIKDQDFLIKFKLKILAPSSDYCINFINDIFSNDPIEIIGDKNNILSFRAIGSCGTLNFTNISGKVIADLNNDCQENNNDKNLEGTVVKFENGGKFYTAITNKNGEYIKNVEPGIYQLSINHPSQLWESCSFNPDIDATDKSKKVSLINYLKPLFVCPKLEVELMNSRLRICDLNSLVINYYNSGTIEANNSIIELKLDQRLELISASRLFTKSGDNTYKFDIGRINSLEGSSIDVLIKTTCDVQELNKTLCMEARIFPNEHCGPKLQSWSGADLRIDSKCIIDKVEFTITNVGKGDMTNELSYAIVEDDLMPNGISKLKLNQNESKIIEVPANGKTIRLLTDTIPYHPYKVRFTSALEACGLNNNSRGFINKFSFGDEDPHLDIFCNTLRGSYDPNDKLGVPTGIGIENNILKTDRIQYLIRFQNTGSDTAFKVEVIDTISPELDLGSIRVEGASHPFTWSNKEDRTLKFLFSPIKLVDSATNEKESNGYILYSIKPMENIANKTKIFNHADIYFDFNPPIRTNTTMHTLGEPITIINNQTSDYSISIFPNPTYDRIIIEFKGPVKDSEIEIYDLFGRPIIQKTLFKRSNEVVLPNTMTTGQYSYKIIKNNQILSSGLIIKHK